MSLCHVLFAIHSCASYYCPQYPQQWTWRRGVCYYDVLWASRFLTSLWFLVRTRTQKALGFARVAISSILSVFPDPYRCVSVLQIGTVFRTVIWIWRIRPWYVYLGKKKSQETAS